MDDVLYHFTCRANLEEISRLNCLNLSMSNFDLNNLSLYPVVWFTSLTTPENQGLKFNYDIPWDLDKTRYRFTVKKQPYMKQWDKWSNEKGMNPEYKQILIGTAKAEETYKTWFVSEQPITFNDILKIENLVEGTVLFEV